MINIFNNFILIFASSRFSNVLGNIVDGIFNVFYSFTGLIFNIF